MAKLRLDKILADTGRWSRKEARELVKRGRVRVNDTAARTADEKYETEGLLLTVDGEAVLHPDHTYIMLHKPGGILSATEDRNQSTVLDLLSPELRKRGLFPVGRLDKDTEGLLLLTDDGELAHRLLSPRHHVDKVYLVQVDGSLNEEDVSALKAGLLLGDGLQCLPAGLKLLPERGKDWAEITLQEGKFHQVKRMMAAREKPVVYLKRLSMGNLLLDPALEKGSYRPLTPEEVENLQFLTGNKV